MTHTNGVASTGNVIRRGLLRKISDTKAALIIVGALLAAGFGAGAFFTGAISVPARVAYLEQNAQQADSIRQTDEAREVLSGRLSHRVDSLESGVRRVERKLDRLPYIESDLRDIKCILSGNRGPSCR